MHRRGTSDRLGSKWGFGEFGGDPKWTVCVYWKRDRSYMEKGEEYGEQAQGFADVHETG
jgi:hypothetical protein